MTVAVLSPTNSYVLLLYPVPELHSTCPSTYATGSTEPGDSHDTCASHPSHLSQVDEKKAKNCAQKHMDFPGRAVRWERESAGAGNTSAKIQPPPGPKRPVQAQRL